METILDCILEIPSFLNNIMVNQDHLFSYLSKKMGDKKYSKIVIVASGSSNNAGFASKGLGEQLLDKNIELYYPNIFAENISEEKLDKDALYIFISQGGSTKLVLDGVKKVNNFNGTTLSITESINSPIASESKIAVEMGSENEPFIYRTIGYSTSVLTLSQVYLYIALSEKLITSEDLDNYNKDAYTAINNLSIISAETLDWFNNHKEYLATKDNFIFSGTGELWPVAVEADIKLMEMMPVLSNSFELEELIHGPQNMFQENYLIFLLVKDNIGKEKANNIIEFIQNEVGDTSIVVSNNKENSPQILVKSESNYYYNLEYITVFQVLAYKLGEQNNRDFNEAIYPKLNDYIQRQV